MPEVALDEIAQEVPVLHEDRVVEAEAFLDALEVRGRGVRPAEELLGVPHHPRDQEDETDDDEDDREGLHQTEREEVPEPHRDPR